MRPIHHVYLVPGFFGFANLGEFLYFQHLERLLPRLFDEAGARVQVVSVHTLPTASVRRRALRLATHLAATAGPEGPIHLVGHSTGGLDARLLTAPDVELGLEGHQLPLVERVRSVLTVATPHYGTPLAAFFGTLLGSHVLRLLSASTVYLLRYGHLPLRFALRLGSVVRRAGRGLGGARNAVDALYDDLLRDFGPARREAVSSFFASVGEDQALVVQLSPDAMDLFNASTGRRPGVAYGSVVTRARPPGWRGRLEGGASAYAQAGYLLYGFLHDRAGRLPERLLPPLSPEQTRRLEAAFGDVPTLEDSDGMVPTRAQVFDEIVAGAAADHLDVIGHFDGAESRPPHVDWLYTGSGFDATAFTDVWRESVAWMLRHG